MDQEIQQKINELERQIEALKNEPPFRDHQHNGFDATPVEYKDLSRKQLYISHTIQGTAAATGTNYGVFWIAPVACVITAFEEVHETAGTDAGTVTVTLEKLTGTTAPDSGNVVLSTALSLKATINSVQTGVLTTTLAYRTLDAGDRLCLKDSGTLTAVANVTVRVQCTVL